jgi:hypothetical protein
MCRKLDFNDKVGAVVAELNASGVTSPKVGSLARVIREEVPVCELNPSLFINRTAK